MDDGALLVTPRKLVTTAADESIRPVNAGCLHSTACIDVMSLRRDAGDALRNYSAGAEPTQKSKGLAGTVLTVVTTVAASAATSHHWRWRGGSSGRHPPSNRSPTTHARETTAA